MATPFKSLRIKVISADSIATSVPVPIASPTSAWASAGASLMPSPTIATTRPSACSRMITAALSWGSTSASTRSTPNCPAMAWAVWTLSPVNITTSRSIRRSLANPSYASGFTVSATAISPMARLSQAKNIGVFPWAARSEACSANPFSGTSESSIKARLPNRTMRPLTWAEMPRPGIAWNPDAGSNVSPRLWASMTMVSPRGCSEPRSADAARNSNSCSEDPAAPETTRSVTTGFPVVSVPVLSKTTVSTL